MGSGNISVSVSGRIEYMSPLGPVVIDPLNVTVNGISLPAFSIGWAAFHIATGVLSNLGGILFNLIATLFGSAGPSLESLLQRQLQEIQRLVQEAIQQEALRKSAAALNVVVDRMKEYMNDPGERWRIQKAADSSLELLAELETLGFAGYTMYLCAASLRMSVLLEYSKVAKEHANYVASLDRALAYHRAWAARVDSETSAYHHALLAGRKGFSGRWLGDEWATAVGHSLGKIDYDILGTRPSELPRLPFDHPQMKQLRWDIACDEWKARTKPTNRGTIGPMPNGMDIALGDVAVKRMLAEENPRIKVVNWDELRAQKYEPTIRVGNIVAEKWQLAKGRAAAILSVGEMERLIETYPELKIDGIESLAR